MKLASGLASVLSLGIASTAPAQVTLDATLGPAGTLAGPDYAITADLGRQVGTNLFHSFGLFNLHANESATFSGPASLEHIISRVTGGQASLIEGTLRTAVPGGANLWFINPSGVTLGQGARLEVQGSFHVSTADYLRLGLSGRFDASVPGNSVLSVASPASFGFLDNSPAALDVQSNLVAVPEGETLSVVAGPVRITGEIAAPAGRIQVASVASTGEVLVGGTGLNVDAFSQLGAILISEQALLDVGGSFDPTSAGGSVFIRAGLLTLDASEISAEGDETSGGVLDIAARDDLLMTGGSTVRSTALGTGTSPEIRISVGGGFGIEAASAVVSESDASGESGGISISAGTLTVSGGGKIASTAFDSGRAGSVTVAVEDRVSIEGPSDFSTGISSDSLSFFDIGNAGAISVTARSLSMNGGVISSRNGFFSSGRAGDISIDATQIELAGGALLVSASSGSGDGGSITVDALESVSLSGLNTGFESRAVDGNSGGIAVTSGLLDLTGGALITASTGGDGVGGDISIAVDRLRVADSQIQSDAPSGFFGASAGRSGNIDIVASESVQLVSETGDVFSRPRISTTTGSDGNAGTISITVPELQVLNGSIESNTLVGTGDAGSIAIHADRIELAEGGVISSSTGLGSSGDGGTVSLRVGEALRIRGRSPPGSSGAIFSAIVTETSGVGEAGTITISAPRVEIDGGFVSASTSASGSARSIELDVGALVLRGGGLLAVATAGNGAAGALEIAAGSILIAGRNEQDGVRSGLYSSTLLDGPAGNISVRTRGLRLEDGATISASSRGSSDAGNIHLQVDHSLELFSSSISSRAETAFGGSVAINGESIGALPDGSLTAIKSGDAAASGFLVRLVDSSITTSVGAGAGDGGNVLIDPDFVILERSRIGASAIGGDGGNILIVSREFLADPGSSLNATSQLGLPGVVEVRAPDTDVSGSITRLPEQFLDATVLLKERCAARSAGSTGSFVVRGRDGLPPSPDRPLASSWVPPVRLGESRTPAPDAHSRSAPLPPLVVLDCHGRRPLP